MFPTHLSDAARAPPFCTSIPGLQVEYAIAQSVQPDLVTNLTFGRWRSICRRAAMSVPCLLHLVKVVSEHSVMCVSSGCTNSRWSFNLRSGATNPPDTRRRVTDGLKTHHVLAHRVRASEQSRPAFRPRRPASFTKCVASRISLFAYFRSSSFATV